MRALLLALAVALTPAAAQEPKKAPPKTPKKMPVAKGHSKPTPEQIRKFNELEKKQGK
jgi:hypothetical protein